MAEITQDQMDALAPFIAGGRPDDRGEIDLFCPLHADVNRSASINVRKGVWYCHAGCGGGSIRALVAAQDTWVAVEGRVAAATVTRPTTVATPNGRVTLDNVRSWHERFLARADVQERLRGLRGITPATARRARIGWDGRTGYFKIPVFGPDRELWNVRTYDPNPSAGRRKIWSVRGMGHARLYPIGQLMKARAGDAVVMCEGEFDTLRVLQAGAHAITRTDGAGKPWHDEWTDYFTDLDVYICHDADRAGQEQNERTADALREVAEGVHWVHLPYPVTDKHGKDLTDYLNDYGDDAIWSLLATSRKEQ